MDTDRLELLDKLASLYYEDRLSQAQIAAKTGYSPSMISRLPMPLTQSNIASWVINFSQRRVARAQEAHNDFDGY